MTVAPAHRGYHLCAQEETTLVPITQLNKNHSYGANAFFENPYMTVERIYCLRALSASPRVARNYFGLYGQQNILVKMIEHSKSGEYFIFALVLSFTSE